MPHFLEQPATLRAVERLAQATDLTVIIGAGASAEAGLPAWAPLIRRLLTHVAERARLRGSAAEDFCEWVVAHEGLVGAGGVAQAVLGDDFLPLARAELYRVTGQDPAPGPTAKAVGLLQSQWGDRCLVFTTNFDLVLERAIRKHVAPASVRPDWEGRGPSGSKEFVVHHLHGILTTTADHDVVLGEAGYYLRPPDPWQDMKMRQRLGDTVCIFAGVSMSDHDLLHWVYRSRTDKRHVALLARQTDVQHGGPQADDRVRVAAERAAFQRWKSTGVTALTPDYFIQSAQFLYEVALRRSVGSSAYVSYGDRLRSWEAGMQASVMRTDNPRLFGMGQDTLQRELRRWLDRVAKTVKSHTKLDDDERLVIRR